MTLGLAHQMRSGEPKLSMLALPRAPQSTLTLVTTSATTDGSRALPEGAPARSAICFGLPALSDTSPATTTTEAEPSGHRDSTTPRSAGSSSERIVEPSGTTPSSGNTVAM